MKNHLASEKLLRMLGTDLFAWHWYVELFVGGRWVKVTPAFNAAPCARFGVPPLGLHGEHDAMLQAFDGEGRRYMEYLRDRGTYQDLPFEEILATFASLYRGAERPDHDEAFDG